MLDIAPAERLFSELVEPSWREALAAEFEKPYMAEIGRTLEEVRVAALTGEATLAPSRSDIFRALNLVPVGKVRAVLVGQDPYPSPGDADGLAFSVRRDFDLPPALSKILAEARRDLGWGRKRTSGDLTPWAHEGVLLLNTALTNLTGRIWAHGGLHWQNFTRAVLETVAHRSSASAILLWGVKAEEFAPIFEGSEHEVFLSDHPCASRRMVEGSGHRPFKGSEPFSKTNAFLQRQPLFDGTMCPGIDWSLPDRVSRAVRRSVLRQAGSSRAVRRRR